MKDTLELLLMTVLVVLSVFASMTVFIVLWRLIVVPLIFWWHDIIDRITR